MQRVRQSLLGQMVTASPCPRCGGLGQVIVTPVPDVPRRGPGHGRQDVPGRRAGRRRHRLHAAPHRPRRGRPAGRQAATCTCTCGSAAHERYVRDDDDLVTDVPISIAQAALGTTLGLATLDGDEDLVIPAGTQPGREFILRQRGVPRLQGRGRGDLRARIRVEVPTKLTEREAELLRQFAEGRGETVGHPKEGLFSRIKSAFS